MRQRSMGALVLMVPALAASASGAAAAEVAVVKSTDAAAWRPTLEALRRSATGQTLTEYDLRGDRAEGERIVASLKGKAAVVVALGPLAAQAAHEGTPEIPLVFCMVQDPAKLGLLNAPNTAGVAFSIPIKNQLAAFRMVDPRAVKVGVIYNPENTGRMVQEAQKAAAVVRLVIVDKAVTSDREIPEALRALLKGPEGVDALWIPPDPILLGDEARRFILSETLRAAKPIYGFSSTLVVEGALASNGPDFASIGEEAAELVNRIVGGEKTSRIEMLVPRAELVINKKIAEKLKIEIPADALRAAAKTF